MEPASGLLWEPELWRLMAQRGWILGQNILVERAFANGKSDLLPRLAEELVRKRVDLILCAGEHEATVAAARATRTIPILAFDMPISFRQDWLIPLHGRDAMSQAWPSVTAWATSACSICEPSFRPQSAFAGFGGMTPS